MGSVDEITLIHPATGDTETLSTDIYVWVNGTGNQFILIPDDAVPAWVTGADAVASHADGSVEAAFRVRATTTERVRHSTTLPSNLYCVLADQADIRTPGFGNTPRP